MPRGGLRRAAADGSAVGAAARSAGPSSKRRRVATTPKPHTGTTGGATCASKDGVAPRFVAALAPRLEKVATSATKVWWENYLKGAAQFRGVKMADTRSAVKALWEEQGLGKMSTATHLEVAHACMRVQWTEDKLAGMLVLAEHALAGLDLTHVDALAQPLIDGSLADWNAVDWYCVKVVGPWIVAGADIEARACSVADWRTGATLWHRRASAVAFVYNVGSKQELFPGYIELLLEICSANVADQTRWSQTSVGWLLRELSKTRKGLVQKWLAAHPELSQEATKNATKYFKK